MQTATERLRQLLDERGVEHIDYKDEATWWSNGDVECAYIQSAILKDKLGQLSFIATPEQAVEATLGRGTCKVVGHGMTVCDDAEFHWYALSCGHRLRTLWAANTVGMYCPHCGREVVE